MSQRNQPCACGSGKLYRKCCGKAATASARVGSSRSAILPGQRRQPPAQLLQEAITLHRAGRVRRAADIYRAILTVEPRHADVLHLLGLSERQLGNFDRAIDLMQQAVSINPDVAMFHSNLAEAWRAQGQLIAAEAACRRAIELEPGLPEAHLNLGAVALEQKDFDAALAAYAQALALRPGYIDALLGRGDALLRVGRYEQALASYWAILDARPASTAALTRIGITLRKQGRVEDAIDHYERAISSYPKIPELHNNVAILYQRVGRLEDAATSLHRLLELKPEDTAARHLLAAFEGKTTERAPADYVRDVFDGYADIFESHLVQKLGYRTPQLLDEAVRAVTSAVARWDVLDLGCGTGLMGEILADRSARLVGIDIAPKMIDKAREKQVYTELVVADILPFMQNSMPASYDLIVAADVFVYLGDLAPIFAEAWRLLRPSGLFVFSVEVAPDESEDFTLDHTGRYRHSAGYLRRVCEANGLEAAQFTQTVIRHQSDQPVSGYLCVFVAPASSP